MYGWNTSLIIITNDTQIYLGFLFNKCEELVNSAFEISKEKYDDEIDIINYAIKILYKYIKDYPELSEELKQQIEDWEDMKSRF